MSTHPPQEIAYLTPIVVITASYAVFQAANNTGVMAHVPQDRRGVVSGLLTLSRNLGLITGASAMGAVFVAASAPTAGAASPELVARGMHVTFAMATGLIVASLAVAAWGRNGATAAVKRNA